MRIYILTLIFSLFILALGVVVYKDAARGCDPGTCFGHGIAPDGNGMGCGCYPVPPYLGCNTCNGACCGGGCDANAWTYGQCANIDANTCAQTRVNECGNAELVNFGCTGGTCCIATQPAAPILTSPSNGATVNVNAPLLQWNINGGFGTGCPNNNTIRVHIQPNCSGGWVNISGNLASSATNYTPSPALDWGRTYCWRVEKHNGSQNVYSPTFNFTTNNPASFTSGGITAGNVCGFPFSGRVGQTNVSNPISYQVNFQDIEGNQFKEIWLAFVPTSISASNVDDLVVNSSAGTNNTIAVRVNLLNGQYSTINGSGAWSGNATTGNLNNSSGTATIMDIGGATNYGVGGNSATATFQIRFNDTFPNGTYNIYTSALTSTGSVDISTGATNTDNTRYIHTGQSWGIDMTMPSSTVSEPTFNPNGTFNVTWGGSDTGGSGLRDVFSYINTDTAGASLRDNTIGLTINPPTAELNYPADTPNAGITTGNLGSHNYTDLNSSLRANYLYKLYVRDQACNVTEVSGAVEPPVPWIMVFGNAVSANGGYQNMVVPDISSFTLPPVSYTGDSFLSEYNAMSGTTDILEKGETSNYNMFTYNYDNAAAEVPLESDLTTWYSHLLDLVRKNDISTREEALTITQMQGNTISAGLVGVPNTAKIWVIENDLTINTGSTVTCDMQGLIFVNGNLNLRPDFVNSSSATGCIFVVSGDVNIIQGDQKTNLPLDSDTLASYDVIEAFIIADGSITIQTDIPAADRKGDGILIMGGMYSRLAPQLGRDINLVGNFKQPAHIFKYDPRYIQFFRNDFAEKYYSIREVID